MRFHRDDSTNAEVTVVSLCTDHRRRNASNSTLLTDWFSGESFEVLIETPDRWRDVVDAAATLPSRDAAAAMVGVMAAADHVPPDQRAGLAEFGVKHGYGSVRLAALPILASTAAADAAIAVAQRDPSAKVRAWNPRPITPVADTSDPAPSTAVADAPRAPPGQASVVDL